MLTLAALLGEALVTGIDRSVEETRSDGLLVCVLDTTNVVGVGNVSG
jgi:hypothetical protein